MFLSAPADIIKIPIIPIVINALQYVNSAMENPLSVLVVFQLPQTLNTFTILSATPNAPPELTQLTLTSPAKPVTPPSTVRPASVQQQTAPPALQEDSFPNLFLAPVSQAARLLVHTPSQT